MTMTRIVKVIRRGRLKIRGGGGGGEDENKDDGCCGGYLCGWLHGANNDVNNVTEVFPIEQIVYSCIRGRERFMRQIAHLAQNHLPTNRTCISPVAPLTKFCTTRRLATCCEQRTLFTGTAGLHQAARTWTTLC